MTSYDLQFQTIQACFHVGVQSNENYFCILSTVLNHENFASTYSQFLQYHQLIPICVSSCVHPSQNKFTLSGSPSERRDMNIGTKALLVC